MPKRLASSSFHRWALRGFPDRKKPSREPSSHSLRVPQDFHSPGPHNLSRDSLSGDSDREILLGTSRFSFGGKGFPDSLAATSSNCLFRISFPMNSPFKEEKLTANLAAVGTAWMGYLSLLGPLLIRDRTGADLLLISSISCSQAGRNDPSFSPSSRSFSQI